jgi:EAL domain-containing protein (putative c-di-GMP-specific phosphodiesterase class I)
MSGVLLEQILGPNALSILVHPIVAVTGRGRRLYGVECLTRGPKLSLFERPDVLFDYVRRKKAELSVDWKVIELALAACSKIPPSIRISINVHASSLGRDPDFAGRLGRYAQNAGMDMARLTIEIVEHAPMWNKPQFRTNVAALRDKGVVIALDDVGAGQSNYHMILDATPDCFKVDSFIVADIASDPRRRAIVASLVKLANELGSGLIVEGVEDERALSVLSDLGVELMQGYLFARPMTVDQLIASDWIAAGLGVGAGG